MTQPIPTDKQAFVHHPKKYGKKRLTKAFRVAGKKGSKMQKIFRYSISKKICENRDGAYLNPGNGLFCLHHSRCFGWLTITDLKKATSSVKYLIREKVNSAQWSRS